MSRSGMALLDRCVALVGDWVAPKRGEDNDDGVSNERPEEQRPRSVLMVGPRGGAQAKAREALTCLLRETSWAVLIEMTGPELEIESRMDLLGLIRRRQRLAGSAESGQGEGRRPTRGVLLLDGLVGSSAIETIRAVIDSAEAFVFGTVHNSRSRSLATHSWLSASGLEPLFDVVVRVPPLSREERRSVIFNTLVARDAPEAERIADALASATAGFSPRELELALHPTRWEGGALFRGPRGGPTRPLLRTQEDRPWNGLVGYADVKAELTKLVMWRWTMASRLEAMGLARGVG